MFPRKFTPAQRRAALGRPHRPLNFKVDEETGCVTVLPAFANRLLDPKWAAMLRRARADGIALPILATVEGKCVDGFRVGFLGTLGD